MERAATGIAQATLSAASVIDFRCVVLDGWMPADMRRDLVRLVNERIAAIRIEGIDTSVYDGLIVAGGWMPDKLRRDSEVLRITREFSEAGKLVAAICHGGWIPISADIYRDVKVTGSPGIKDDLINAGGIFEDAPVVVDRHFVSSRRPDDLPEFCRAILDFYA